MEFCRSFQIGEKDCFRFHYYVVRKSLLGYAIMVFLVILLLRGFVLYGQSNSILDTLWRTLPLAAGGGLLLFFGSILVLRLRLYFLYRGKPASHFAQEIRLDSAGVRVTPVNGKHELAWHQIVRVKELPQYFYLFLSAQMAYVMPKAQLQSEAELALLRDIFRANMDAKLVQLMACVAV